MPNKCTGDRSDNREGARGTVQLGGFHPLLVGEGRRRYLACMLISLHIIQLHVETTKRSGLCLWFGFVHKSCLRTSLGPG